MHVDAFEGVIGLEGKNRLHLLEAPAVGPLMLSPCSLPCSAF
jgi:hypothetical protein